MCGCGAPLDLPFPHSRLICSLARSLARSHPQHLDILVGSSACTHAVRYTHARTRTHARMIIQTNRHARCGGILIHVARPADVKNAQICRQPLSAIIGCIMKATNLHTLYHASGHACGSSTAKDLERCVFSFPYRPCPNTLIFHVYQIQFIHFFVV